MGTTPLGKTGVRPKPIRAYTVPVPTETPVNNVMIRMLIYN